MSIDPNLHSEIKDGWYGWECPHCHNPNAEGHVPGDDESLECPMCGHFFTPIEIDGEEDEGVKFVSMGYKWTCPKCTRVNLEGWHDLFDWLTCPACQTRHKITTVIE